MDDRLQHKLQAEADLAYFITLVHPKRLLGNVHREVIQWWTSQEASKYQLLLLPRDHMKSALIAYRAAWELTKDPTLRILYISSTSNLATKQLKFIKDILTSETYRLFWPEMVLEEEAKREKWTEREISVDHPRRKEESVRDPSIFTAGLTTNIVGMHCDIAILDDVVVAGNAYTEQGRDKVRQQYGYLSSIEGTNAREWLVGTRYHPSDLYSDIIGMESKQFDSLGNVIETRSLFEVFERQVESVGDGTGEFLWPRQQRSDGQWFGFDAQILGDKREKYSHNQIEFRAQYYNDPHDVGSSAFGRDNFQYYDRKYLFEKDGRWYFKGQRLNVVASVDFAFSTNKKADYTAIVVVGADADGYIYVLDIDRFRTDRYSDYFTRIFKLYDKWGFRQLRAEVSVAQKIIVTEIKDQIRKLGLSLAIDEFRPSRWQGSKEERIYATLEPKYANKQIWHYMGGNCQILEEELMFANPAHDDVKDALTSAVDFVIAPKNMFRKLKESMPLLSFNSKFGGCS